MQDKYQKDKQDKQDKQDPLEYIGDKVADFLDWLTVYLLEKLWQLIECVCKLIIGVTEYLYTQSLAVLKKIYIKIKFFFVKRLSKKMQEPIIKPILAVKPTAIINTENLISYLYSNPVDYKLDTTCIEYLCDLTRDIIDVNSVELLDYLVFLNKMACFATNQSITKLERVARTQKKLSKITELSNSLLSITKNITFNNSIDVSAKFKELDEIHIVQTKIIESNKTEEVLEVNTIKELDDKVNFSKTASLYLYGFFVLIIILFLFKRW